MNLGEMSTVVCFLAINKMPEISRVSINSVLLSSSCPVVVGYIRESDIEELPKNNRIRYLKLATSGEIKIDENNSEYKDFSQDEFFTLVQYKWILFQEIMKEKYSVIIYSDLDVIWNTDASKIVSSSFAERDELQILVQSFSSTPMQPRLCMGFFGFRNSTITSDFIQMAKNKHSEMSAINPKIGDDDVITKLYSELNYPNWIHELPQSTFPVGNMLTLFTANSSFPGLSSPSPAIFHANFVVGITNKRILMRLFMSKKMKRKLEVNRNIKLDLILVAKRIINFRRRLLKRISS